MNTGPFEAYAPRTVSDLGVWNVSALRVKAYGLIAEGQSVTDAMIAMARQGLASDVAARVEAMGDSNGLGFVIIHPGTLGVSISSHWWVQGSVLCQHNFRQLYGADAPMDTSARPVVACVYELELIQAEQAAWRCCMMGAGPDATAYLAARAG